MVWSSLTRLVVTALQHDVRAHLVAQRRERVLRVEEGLLELVDGARELRVIRLGSLRHVLTS